MPFRYVWPSELDLMARLTGMKLRGRWGGWNRRPFNQRQHHSRVSLGEDRVASWPGIVSSDVRFTALR